MNILSWKSDVNDSSHEDSHLEDLHLEIVMLLVYIRTITQGGRFQAKTQGKRKTALVCILSTKKRHL